MLDAGQGSEMARRQGRSPSYPSIDLERAIGRARELWERDKQFSTPVLAAVKLWGYKGLTGPSGMTVAALKKFGLIEDEGSKSDRKIRVTDLAVTILNHPESKVREAAIREAALNPGIHALMWGEYGSSLPSDDNLMWMLTREMGFTETGAREFLREYRQTVRFAGLADGVDTGGASTSAQVPVSQGLEPTVTGEIQSPTSGRFTVDATAGAAEHRVTANGRRYPIRLPDGQDIVLEGSFPLSEEAWSYFYSLLGHMKPAFTSTVGRDE